MALAIARLRIAALASLPRRPRGARLWPIAGWAAALVVAVVLVPLVQWWPETLSVVATTGTIAAIGHGVAGERDGALDPRSFRGLAHGTSIAIGTALGALVSPGTIVALALGAAALPIAGPVAALGGLVLAATWALARLVADVGVQRDRSIIGAVLTFVLVIVVLAPFVLAFDDPWHVVRSLPFAAPLTFVLDAPLVVAIATPVALAIVWACMVAFRIARPDRAETSKKLGFFRFAQFYPWQAVAARVATLWLRDRRYHVIAIACVLVPVGIAVPLALAGLPTESWTLLPALLLCAMLGWSTHNDLAYDGTASWQQLAARVPGWQDRLGRMLPSLCVGVPAAVLTSRVGVTLWGDEDVWWPLLGASLALLGSGLGTSAVIGARWPYPVGTADESPFVAPASQSSSAACTQAVALFATILFGSPAVFTLFLFLERPEPLWGWLGTLLGVIVAGTGVVAGGAILDRRAPLILAAAMRD